MWEDVKADNNYEILNCEPYTIRNKKTKRIIKGWKNKKGYVQLELSKKHYQLHRILAEQFTTNENEGFKQIDHKNGIKDDNNLSNLRWVDNSLNNINRNGYKNVKFDYFEELPPNVHKVISYNGKTPDYAYYIDDFNNVYFDNGTRIRILHYRNEKNRAPRVSIYINHKMFLVNPLKLVVD